MASGWVQFFNSDRGYGFIATDGGGSDVFVHITAVEAAGMKTLVAGQLLEYDIGQPRASPRSRASACALCGGGRRWRLRWPRGRRLSWSRRQYSGAEGEVSFRCAHVRLFRLGLDSKKSPGFLR